MRKLMRSLARDERGNVLFISAISIIVLMVLGGSALDISRMYLVKNRLQQACDAGVLAYRRTMKGTNTTTDTWKTSKAYFDANYTPGRYGTANPIFPEPTVDANVVVHGVASVVVPMTLMKFFGMNESTLETKCDAQLQLPNTDVMFVLDTTGSMTNTNPGDPDDRITTLRKAVLSFYNTLEAAKVTGTQVRYGFVPYSNTVNVGMLLKREWMADKATYQSREFVQQDTVTTTNTAGATITTYGPWSNPLASPTVTTSRGDPENCVAQANTDVTTSTTVWNPSSTAVPRSGVTTKTYSGDTFSAVIDASGQCTITKKSYPKSSQSQTVDVKPNPNAGTTTTSKSYRNYWTYKPVELPISGYKGGGGSGLMSGGTVNFPLSNPDNDSQTPKNVAVPWTAANACIEERKTLQPLEFGTAWDMDIDAVPTSNPDTQWKPFLPMVVYARNVGSYPTNGTTPTGWSYGPTLKVTNNYARIFDQRPLVNGCPSPARKLQTKEAGLTAQALQNYLGGLVTRGWTYHDVGFLWGLRLLSKEGLFASENATAPNGSSIGRNIILMTDGNTDTHIEAYDAYGLSALDRRRTIPLLLPTDAGQDAIVEDRLNKYCTIAKEQKGITVWTIAFGDEVTSLAMLEKCASKGRAFQAKNAKELNDTFADIAAKIAQLRLTK